MMTSESGRSRNLLIGIVLVLGILSVAVVTLSSRRRQVVTVDGSERWNYENAPPRRQIVWQEAKPIEIDLDGLPPSVELARPEFIKQPSGGGDVEVLYVTVRFENDQYDIYRFHAVDEVWTDPEPVDVFNSEKNDIGPVISKDGRWAFLYSDRDDGLGGMDIYRSERQGDKWSKPKNLGPNVNSSADEYDPAVTSDGSRLVFSSNRRHKSTGTASSTQRPQWRQTLRAELAQTDFNVFESTLSKDQWQPASRITGINTPYHEGTPYFDHTDSYLYFTSDRPARPGEPRNFDIYRTLIGSTGSGSPEPLGNGVNSPANEVEPALRSGNFQLVFSRSNEEGQYGLHQSTSKEIQLREFYDNQRWIALGNWISQNRWWLLTALLVLALLASLIWFLRNQSWRRLPVPGFFTIALLLHLLLITGSFFTYLGQHIVANLSSSDEEVVADEVLIQSNQSHDQGQEAYEKVAELTDFEAIEPVDVQRQVTEVPNVPMPIETAIPQIPSRLTQSSTTEAVVATVPVQPSKVSPSPIQRQPNRSAPATAAPTVAIEQTIQKTIEEMSQPQQQQVSVQRQPSVPLPARAPQSVQQSEPLKVALAMTTESVEPVRVDVPRSQIEAELNRTAPSQAAPSKSEAIATQEVTPQAVPTQQATEALPIDQARIAISKPELSRAQLAPLVEPQENPDLRIAELPLLPTPAIIEPPQSPTTTEPIARAMPTAPALERTPSEISVDQVAAVTVETPTTPPTLKVTMQPKPILPETESSAAPLPYVASATVAPSEVKPVLLSSPSPIEPAVPLTQSTANPLARASQTPIEMQSAAAIEIDEPALTPAPLAPSPAQATAVNVPLPRNKIAALPVPENRLTVAGGLSNPLNSRLVLGSMAAQRVDAPVSVSPIASRLLRRPARAPETEYAGDAVNLRSLLRRRNIDANTKAAIVKQYGGSDETLETIQRGITWIESHQHRDGHWSINAFHQNCQGHKRCNGMGGSRSDTAATGLALLPMLGDGNTHLEGPFQESVARGITWLVKNQHESGDLFTGGESNARMYSHGIATIALCECYGMSGDISLRGPAQRAVDFIVASQHEPTGGWRYQPNQPGDTSVVGWQVMALKSAQMADLNVPQKTLDGAKKWIDKAEGTGGRQGQYYYQGGRFNAAMSAEGLLCMEYLGALRGSAQLQHGSDYLLKNLPANGRETSYYWYYGTQVMFHLQGEHWNQWNAALHDMLVDTQVKEGPMAGTWDPKDSWEKRGGRIYSTSLRLLMLEVYYRHLPLYQVLE